MKKENINFQKSKLISNSRIHKELNKYTVVRITRKKITFLTPFKMRFDTKGVLLSTLSKIYEKIKY